MIEDNDLKIVPLQRIVQLLSQFISFQVKDPVPSASARHTKYKVRIGWKNFYKGEYHLVTAITGGGIRTIEYGKDAPQTVTRDHEMILTLTMI